MSDNNNNRLRRLQMRSNGMSQRNGMLRNISYFGNRTRNDMLDLVGTLASAPEFSTLVTAVNKAGLAGALSAPNGPYTVFVPTNSAFNTLPSKTLSTLLANPLGPLANILKYHVVSGKVLSNQLYNGQEITTINGEKLHVYIRDSIVYIQNNDRSINARVITPDVMASNGVAHVIESVLVPRSKTTGYFGNRTRNAMTTIIKKRGG